MTLLLTVVSGGMDTGKSLVAQALVREKGYTHVIRDDVRAIMPDLTDEWRVTLETFRMAADALAQGRDVIAVGWNLEQADYEGWKDVARKAGAKLRWIKCANVEVG